MSVWREREKENDAHVMLMYASSDSKCVTACGCKLSTSVKEKKRREGARPVKSVTQCKCASVSVTQSGNRCAILGIHMAQC